MPTTPTTTRRTTGPKTTERLRTPPPVVKPKPVATPSGPHGALDVVTRGGRDLSSPTQQTPVTQAARHASLVAVRTGGAGVVGGVGGAGAGADVIHEIKTRADFDKLFQTGASVTAGAPSELKFLIDRKTHQMYFVPPKYEFHFTFYQGALHGTMDNGEFDAKAYNVPNRDFIAGTITAYDSFVDAAGKKGKLCYSLWPTDRFTPDLLKETHDAVAKGLKFLKPGEDVAFRPGGPIQDRLVKDNAAALKTLKVEVKTNLEISKGLKYMALSQGESVGRAVIIEKGAAMPALGRGDVAIFLGDVPAEAPPCAGIITTEVQTFNSHLGIKCRQDDIPYFYKALTPAEITELRKLSGKFVKLNSSAKDGTFATATEAEATAYLKKIKPTGDIRLTPNLKENKARTFADLNKIAVKGGKWNHETLAAYGRKTLGVAQLAELKKSGKLDVSAPGEPEVVAPANGFGIPANWYARFVKTATDQNGVTFSDRIKTVTSNPKFADIPWRAKQLEALRKDMEDATMPAALLKDIREQVAVPYLKMFPGDERARMRSSAPVVEDGGVGKLPNMAGAFDSHTAKWKTKSTAKATADAATKAMAEALMKDYAAVWNDRAVSELDWNNVDMDEGSVAMAVLVMPAEEDEKANGVLRTNPDTAGFYSITGETQYGENLVTNPAQGATPDTWIDGNYDVFGNGTSAQDIEYERVSNQKSTDPAREHAYTDKEISVAYKGMHVIRDHFAALEGKKPNEYVNECETKILANGQVQFKQERPWVE